MSDIPSTLTFYTIGHSNRRIEEFLSILGAVAVRCLVDVRAHPRSRRHPHFSDAALRQSLEQAGIIYHWAGRALGGHRRPRPDSPHTALSEPAFRGYADHMDSADFQRGASQLVNLARRAPTVLMCAEKQPEDCHRALISDYLSLEGHRIVHLIGPGHHVEHMLSPLARRESRRLVYDRMTTGELGFPA